MVTQLTWKQGRDLGQKLKAPKVQIRNWQERTKLSGKRTLLSFSLESFLHSGSTDGAIPRLRLVHFNQALRPGESLRSITEDAQAVFVRPFLIATILSKEPLDEYSCQLEIYQD
jgi:hypothetical protein